MNIVNFTSGINNIEQNESLSEWAAKYIFSQNLSRENFTSTDSFRNLPRRQKDAIRYQLRKGVQAPKEQVVTRQPKPVPVRTQPKAKKRVDVMLVGKIGLGLWISVFLLFDIVQIYIAKGASTSLAWQAAVLVEVCILSAAVSPQSKLRRVAYALFGYNLLLFAFMEADQALAKISMSQTQAVITESKQVALEKLKSQFEDLRNETERSRDRLAVASAKGYITSGSAAFERESQILAENASSLTGQISNITFEILNEKKAMHTSFGIWMTSLLYFLLRCILQFFAIKLLNPRDSKSG